MMAEWNYETGLARAQAYCAGAERCNSEVRAMLERHGLPDSHISRILRSLADDNFVNEARYADAFVNDKIRFDHWGRRKIAHALKMKRIDDAVISLAIEGVDMQEYMDVLGQVVKNCYRQAKAATPYLRKMKTLRSVASRGFEPELACKFIADSRGESSTGFFDEVL